MNAPPVEGRLRRLTRWEVLSRRPTHSPRGRIGVGRRWIAGDVGGQAPDDRQDGTSLESVAGDVARVDEAAPSRAVVREGWVGRLGGPRAVCREVRPSGPLGPVPGGRPDETRRAVRSRRPVLARRAPSRGARTAPHPSREAGWGAVGSSSPEQDRCEGPYAGFARSALAQSGGSAWPGRGMAADGACVGRGTARRQEPPSGTGGYERGLRVRSHAVSEGGLEPPRPNTGTSTSS